MIQILLADAEHGAVGLRLVRWAVDVGEHVGFGDVVAEVVVQERLRADRGRSATQVVRYLSRGRGQQAKTSRPEAGDAGVKTTNTWFELVASDDGFVRQLLVTPRSSLSAGEPMAVLSSSPDEPVDGVAEAPPFRIVAQRMEADITTIRFLD